MSGHDDFDFEPIPGLPGTLPVGETMLWQGRPSTRALARDAFGLPLIAAYFAVLMVWRGAVGFEAGGMPMALAYGLPYVGLGLLCCGVVLALAFAQARATVYTITSARVVMRIGAALSVTFNLPFAEVGTARLSGSRDGTGTIALDTLGETRISYLVAWPHVRPWHLAKVQPALRCIPDAASVARILGEAAEARLSRPLVVRTTETGTQPATSRATAAFAAE